MNKYFAELLGTFVLALAVIVSLSGVFILPTPVLAALTVGVFVYTIGRISGTHLNPAVTLGILSIKKISVRDAVGYIIAQFGGAGLAMLVAQVFIPILPIVPVSDSVWVVLAEVLGTFILVFGIASVVYGKVSRELSGVVIGGSLLLGIALASSGSNGILNPAVAMALYSLSLSYVVGPLLGGLLGVWVFKFLSRE